MIRLETTNLQGITPDQLPPTKRQGPARVLFLSTAYLGFGNYHNSMRQFAEGREDLDAVFVRLERPKWMALVGKGMPQLNGWDQHAWRYYKMWRWVIRKWLKTALPLERFDAVHIVTENNAGALLDYTSAATKFAVNIDATAAQAVSEFGKSRLGTLPLHRAETKLYAHADLVVCRNAWCSGSLREDFGVPEQRVHICRNSLVPPETHRGQHPARAAGELVRLAFVGNDFVRKCGPELLKLHQEKLADRVELHVCSRLAVPDHAAKNVIWHGAVDREKLLGEVLPSMDMFTLPTRHDMHPGRFWKRRPAACRWSLPA